MCTCHLLMSMINSIHLVRFSNPYLKHVFCQDFMLMFKPFCTFKACYIPPLGWFLEIIDTLTVISRVTKTERSENIPLRLSLHNQRREVAVLLTDITTPCVRVLHGDEFKNVIHIYMRHGRPSIGIGSILA